MELNGIPLHPLVVHAVVVLTPFAALLGVLYAVVPRWRWALRWPLVAVTLAGVVTAFVATYTGQDLARSRGLGALEAVQKHQQAGVWLRNVMVAFTVVVGLAAWRLGGPSALLSGGGERPAPGGIGTLLTVGALVVGSLALGVAVFLAGDSGARAVWGS
ncbi:MAG: DUF2231 domain-containing protein [Nocardioides sp.]